MAAATAFEQAYGPVFAELRAFLGRAVRAIVEQGVDGFLVFGAGVLLRRCTPSSDGIVPVNRWRPAGVPVDVPDASHGVPATRGAD
ncbi:hypothetical protein [Micromonospora sp. NPDC005979]|uniref:hypothetical protein n=1 Tax=Micromonospora sp. NPDC005979 TaxID=3156726 RepID=UPI0033A6639F